MTSQNIPQLLTEGFRDIEEDPKAVPFDGVKIVDTPVQSTLPNEIIVDNEDPEFEVTTNRTESLLEKWILHEDEAEQKYSGMNYWRPPMHWTDITNSDFYGAYIRSGYYIKSGDGSQVAKWHVPLKKAGYYDVYYHLYKSRRFGRGRNGGDDKGEYNFTIYADGDPVQQALNYQSADEGWNNLGSYYFSSDTALIELSDKSQLRMIFADAVKLVAQ